MKEVLYEVRCLKSTEDMILALGVRGSYLQLISNTALHITLLSYSVGNVKFQDVGA